MIKKTLFFQSPCHLQAKRKQLVITLKESGEIKERPAEDIGFVILDHPQITFTQSVMQLLSGNNTAVIFCDTKHHPSSMLLHLEGHHRQTAYFRAQIEASIPLKKQLWQQTVKAKIRNQAAHLAYRGYPPDGLLYIAKKVTSGDRSNEEARAARNYWPHLFGNDFLRSRAGAPPNNALNYGYAVLRAAVARALTGSGLLPALGIHHHNIYNAFCLADDIMEPYRPFVDREVCELQDGGERFEEFKTAQKTALIRVLDGDVIINKKRRPLMTALSETTASLARCFKGEAKKISYPKL